MGGVSSTRTTAYLPTGEVRSVTDELGHTTTSAYDAADRRTSVTNGRGKVRTYAFTSRGGATTYDLHDRLGTAAKQTGSAVSVTATRTYDAFGMLVSSSGTPQGPFGFAATSGYQEDGDSGLKLLGHRYYDPSTGRFLIRDPAQDGRNWYAYCGNNPTKCLDADGHLFWLIAIVVVAVLLEGCSKPPSDNNTPGNVGTTLPGYAAPSGGSEAAGAASVAGPLTGLGKLRGVQKKEGRSLDNGDDDPTYDNVDQDGDRSGRRKYKGVLGKYGAGGY